MDSDSQKVCTLCGALIDNAEQNSPFVEAGEWLAENVWEDGGALCAVCLENRGRLAMMYLHDRNR